LLFSVPCSFVSIMARYFALVGSVAAVTQPEFTLWFGNK